MKRYLSLDKIFQFLMGLYFGLLIGEKRPELWSARAGAEKPEQNKIIIGIYSNAENMRTRGEAIYNTWFKRTQGGI